MDANKILTKTLFSSTTTVSVWAILSRIAYAEGEDGGVTNNTLPELDPAITKFVTEQIAPLQTQIAELKKELSNIALPDIFGLSVDTAIYILFGIAIVALIFSLISAYTLSNSISKDYISKTTYNEKIKELEDKNKEYTDKINKLTSELEKNTSSIKKIQAYLEERYRAELKKAQQEKNLINNTTEISPITKTQEQIALEQRRELENLWKPFIHDYNNLSYNKTNSFQDRTDRKNFVQNNTIKSFDCTNFEARLRSPSLAIEFASVDTANGMYWALPLKNSLYAVVPNLKTTYEFQLHETAGMKETFISNYDKGSYNKIIVKKPAIFDYANGNWTLKERGEIELSN